jgi:acetyltransferase-like isoleucine patch superfamily enzyme
MALTSLLYAVPRVRGLVVRLQSLAFGVLYRRNVGAGARVFGWPLVRLAPGSRLRAGKRLVLISASQFSEWALNHRCHISLSSDATLEIGDDVGMSGATIVCRQSIRIGNRVLVGANVTNTDTDSHAVDRIPRRYLREGVRSAPVVIGDDVFIGGNSIVLKGSTIGDGSVIGAGSVVTGSIPAGVLAAGNPARVLRQLPREGSQL